MAGQQDRVASAIRHRNVDIARDLWVATAEADEASIRRLLAPDIEWRTFSSGELSGTLRGVDEVIDLLARSGETVDALTTDLIDIYASDDGAVTHYRVRANRGERVLDTEVLLVMRIRSGRVHSAFAVPVDARLPDSFWLSH